MSARTQIEPHEDTQLRLLAAHVQDHAVFLADGEGRVASWNPAAQRLFGHAPREALGRHVAILHVAPTEHGGDDGKPWSTLEAAARLGRVEDEGPRRRRDGSTFLASEIVSAFRGRGGRLQGFAVVTRDVTERRRAEAERERLARAQEIARIQTAFLAALAHELRTPVLSLRLEVECLVRQLRRGDAAAGLERLLPRLAGLTRQSDRLARLIDAFLALPRFGGDGAALSTAPVDAAATFRGVADELRRDGAVAAIPVEIDDGGRGVRLEADPALLELVAWVLLSNAFRYGGGAPVEVRIARAENEATVAVRDRGIGIAPEDQARIFEPFERAVPSTAYAGIGLGLWIARQIAAAHGGSLAVESAPGEGATFLLRLPQ